MLPLGDWPVIPLSSPGAAGLPLVSWEGTQTGVKLLYTQGRNVNERTQKENEEAEILERKENLGERTQRKLEKDEKQVGEILVIYQTFLVTNSFTQSHFLKILA